MSRAWMERNLRENTEIIEEFCAKHNLSLKYLNNGYQLRVNDVIDLYPVRQKWHYIKTGQRGTWEDINDLDLGIFYTYRTPEREYVMPPMVDPKTGKRKIDVRGFDSGLNLEPPEIDSFRLKAETGRVETHWFYRKWWHRLTRHKTTAHYVVDENITWYFDERKKEWFM